METIELRQNKMEEGQLKQPNVCANEWTKRDTLADSPARDLICAEKTLIMSTRVGLSKPNICPNEWTNKPTPEECREKEI